MYLLWSYCFLFTEPKQNPAGIAPAESWKENRQKTFEVDILISIWRRRNSKKDGLGTDTCRSFAGFCDASKDNQVTPIICIIWKSPTEGDFQNQSIILLFWKKQRLNLFSYWKSNIGCNFSKFMGDLNCELSNVWTT